MSAVDFEVLKRIPDILKLMESMQEELHELKQYVKPKYDLTKRDGVKKFLEIGDATLSTMMKDGRLKQGVHFTKAIKGKKIRITFVEDAILDFKEKY